MRRCLRALLAVAVCGAAVPIAGRLAAQAPASCSAATYDCAIAQVQRHEFAPAIVTLELLAAKSPRDLKILNLLGIALTGAGKPDAANARFRAALAIDPRFAPALRNLAVNEFTIGDDRAAERHFKEVLGQAPDDEVAHQHLGEIYFARKQCRVALPHYAKSRVRIEQQPGLLLHNATCLLEEKETVAAVAMLDRLPADPADRWFEAGVLLGRYDAHADAARFFATARRNGYQDPYAAGYNQVLMLVDAGSHEAAIATANDLFALGMKQAELYNLVSRAYAKTNRIKDAYDALREAARLEPAVDDHYLDLAMLCLEHKNYELALEIVDIGLGHRRDAPMLLLQRGVVLAMSGDSEAAEDAFARANRAAPELPAPYVALAMIWMQRGQTPRAVELLRARTRVAAVATPPQAMVFYALGIALLRAGAAPEDVAGSEALSAFRTATRLQPALAQAQAELGKLLLKRGDVQTAVTHLERAMALDPQNATPAYLLAQAYRRVGQIDRARDLLARVSTLNAQERGDDPDADLRPLMFRIIRENRPATTARPERAADLAAACAAAGDLDGAIERLREAVRSSPADQDIRYQLSATLWNRHQRATRRRQPADLVEAVELVKEALARQPDRAHYHLLLGHLLAEQQLYPAAIEHLRKAGDPYNLGVALRLAGDVDAAAAQFRAAVEADPAHALARRSLGLLLRQNGDLKAASTELRRAASDMPDDAQGRFLLGGVLLRLGDAVGAVAELREAIRLNPALIEARATLAQALAKTGHQDEALQQQAEVRRLNEEKSAFGRALVLLDASAAQLSKGDVAGAIARRREAVALSPSFADAHYQLGLALQQAERRADAEQAFRDAIANDATHAPAYLALADLLERRGDANGARDARARAKAAAPCS